MKIEIDFVVCTRCNFPLSKDRCHNAYLDFMTSKDATKGCWHPL